MNAEPTLPLETIICGRCATVCEADDNFCRYCGVGLREQQLPAVRDSAGAAVVWQPRARSLALRSVAVVAAGALTEMLARRLVRRTVGRVFGGGGRASTKLARRQVEHTNGSTPDDAQLVSDTLLVRHIRVRR